MIICPAADWCSSWVAHSLWMRLFVVIYAGFSQTFVSSFTSTLLENLSLIHFTRPIGLHKSFTFVRKFLRIGFCFITGAPTYSTVVSFPIFFKIMVKQMNESWDYRASEAEAEAVRTGWSCWKRKRKRLSTNCLRFRKIESHFTSWVELFHQKINCHERN